LPGKRSVSRCASPLPSQSPHSRPRTPRRCHLPTLPLAICAHRAPACLLRNSPFRRRRKPHACSSRFRKTDGNRLLRGSRSMLSFANMMHLLANKLARLR
jgi:hypothetical protein